MSKRSTDHATFVIERSYDAPRERVFSAWADQASKSRWFGPGEEHELDFRIGGREHLLARMDDGTAYSFDAIYQDIVENERIIYSYDMHRDDVRISVSVTTVEMLPSGEGTLLRFTEQGAFLDGGDNPEAREHGTGKLLEALGETLAQEVHAS